MIVGVIGLGKMGLQIARKLAAAKFKVIGYDPNSAALPADAVSTIDIATTMTELAQKVEIAWTMVPAGEIVDTCIFEIAPHLRSNAIVIDGGNSFYKDSIRRAQSLETKGLHFLDCGTSGGTHGLEHGFSLMVGGNEEAFKRATPIFKVLAAPGGFGHVGQAGAGHFVKMVHNGIEYALLQGYSEGFHILREGPYKDLDLAAISTIWQNGSVIRSWILALAQSVFEQDQQLTHVNGHIDENKTGRWTLEAANELNIPVPAIKAALDSRSFSRETGGNFATKVVAMLRNAFGGHAVKRKE